MGSRLVPLCLVLAAIAVATADLQRLALYLGLVAVPYAAGAAFVAISDALEGRPARLRAVTNGLALVLVVVASAVRESAAHGAAVPPFVFYALAGAVVAYAVPTLAWILEPVRLSRPLGARSSASRAAG